MKVVVAGKGGAGKTTVAAILARTIARSGVPVLALDADPNPNLGLALGLGLERTLALDSAVNATLRESKHDHTNRGVSDPPPVEGDDELVRRLMVAGPDGVRLLQTGRIERPADGCLCCGSHLATRRLFHDITVDGGFVIADLEPGVNDLIWVAPQPRDVVIVVTQAYRKSLEVAARTLQVAHDLGVQRIVVLANRLQGPADAMLVRRRFPGAEVVDVPIDPTIAKAGTKGEGVGEPTSVGPAVRALAALGAGLVADAVARTASADLANSSQAVSFGRF